mmetsp:Transcript_18436/g.48122  ORF Transcript_18436/g.48122 Transcript_18436/m.48122 type:complete len:315 (+) Transcript_18436:193-1137(+)
MATFLRDVAEYVAPGSAALREGLTALSALYARGNGPTDLILGLHCLYCAAVLRMPELHAGGHRWLLSFWAVFAGAFGGGTLTALLMMRPDMAPVPAFVDARLLPYIAAAWYFVHYTRLGAWLLGLPLVRLICRLATTYCRAGLICARAEMAASLYPGVVGAHLLLGTIAGTGGTLLCDAIKHALGGLARPAELSAPSWALRSGFLGATVYLSAVHYLPQEFQLEPLQAKALVTTMLLLQAVLSTLWGAEIDLTRPLDAAFHALSGIPPFPQPLPPSAQQPAAPKAKANRTLKAKGLSSADAVELDSSVSQKKTK